MAVKPAPKGYTLDEANVAKALCAIGTLQITQPMGESVPATEMRTPPQVQSASEMPLESWLQDSRIRELLAKPLPQGMSIDPMMGSAGPAQFRASSTGEVQMPMSDADREEDQMQGVNQFSDGNETEDELLDESPVALTVTSTPRKTARLLGVSELLKLAKQLGIDGSYLGSQVSVEERERASPEFALLYRCYESFRAYLKPSRHKNPLILQGLIEREINKPYSQESQKNFKEILIQLYQKRKIREAMSHHQNPVADIEETIEEFRGQKRMQAQSAPQVPQFMANSTGEAQAPMAGADRVEDQRRGENQLSDGLDPQQRTGVAWLASYSGYIPAHPMSLPQPAVFLPSHGSRGVPMERGPQVYFDQGQPFYFQPILMNTGLGAPWAFQVVPVQINPAPVIGEAGPAQPAVALTSKASSVVPPKKKNSGKTVIGGKGLINIAKELAIPGPYPHGSKIRAEQRNRYPEFAHLHNCYENLREFFKALSHRECGSD
jgi:hypothetical protein